MFLNVLDELMKKNGLNKNTLSKKSGIPYTTIDGFYKKGCDNTKLSTLRQLAKFFNVSLDYLIEGKDTYAINHTYLSKIETLYNQLDIEDQAEIRGEIKQMLKSEKYKTSKSIAEDIVDELKEDAHITVTKSKQ